MWENVVCARSSPRFYNVRKAVSWDWSKQMNNKIKTEYFNKIYIESYAAIILISISVIEEERDAPQLETFLLWVGKTMCWVMALVGIISIMLPCTLKNCISEVMGWVCAGTVLGLCAPWKGPGKHRLELKLMEFCHCLSWSQVSSPGVKEVLSPLLQFCYRHRLRAQFIPCLSQI